jgi:hypothetical protein
VFELKPSPGPFSALNELSEPVAAEMGHADTAIRL